MNVSAASPEVAGVAHNTRGRIQRERTTGGTLSHDTSGLGISQEREPTADEKQKQMQKIRRLNKAKRMRVQ